MRWWAIIDGAQMGPIDSANRGARRALYDWVSIQLRGFASGPTYITL